MRKLMFTTLMVACLLFSVGLVMADSHGEIMGIQWQWAELTETEPASQSIVPNPENYVLVLNADGTANLKADCNQVGWTYTVEGGVLTFNTLGPSTLAFCGDESLDQLFLAKLGMGGAFSVENERLVLVLNENAGTMTFDNGGAVEAPPTIPETGGALAVAPWLVTALAGLTITGAGVALRRKR
jgi:heat shock protein HslJ